MVRTISLAGCLSKMTQVLAGRLRASPMAGWAGELVIADGVEAVTLRFQRGRCHVPAGVPKPRGQQPSSIRGGDEIAQLLLGTDEPGEILESAGMQVTGDAGQLAGVLFPAQHPVLSQWDHY
jgi:hypothetical protein